MQAAPYAEKLFTGGVERLGNANAPNRFERPWETGMFKSSTDSPVWLGETGLTNDYVADTKHHGGPEKAVFAYSSKHYTYWNKELSLNSIAAGGMGENLSLTMADEDTICIGDTYQFGESIIQVSQPRQPCWKPARRYRQLDFALRIQQSGRTGWYFRVLKEGYVQKGQQLILMERPYPQWTVAACNEVMHHKKDDVQLTEALAGCEVLAVNWKNTLKKRMEGKQSSIEKRVFGPNKA